MPLWRFLLAAVAALSACFGSLAAAALPPTPAGEAVAFAGGCRAAGLCSCPDLPDVWLLGRLGADVAAAAEPDCTAAQF